MISRSPLPTSRTLISSLIFAPLEHRFRKTGNLYSFFFNKKVFLKQRLFLWAKRRSILRPLLGSSEGTPPPYWCSVCLPLGPLDSNGLWAHYRSKLLFSSPPSVGKLRFSIFSRTRMSPSLLEATMVVSSLQCPYAIYNATDCRRVGVAAGYKWQGIQYSSICRCTPPLFVSRFHLEKIGEAQ